MVSKDFQKQLSGYGLTTANILYRRPDHPWLLQSYVWQAYDLCPGFPELQRFLDFWRKSLDGDLHTVMVAHSKMIKPADCARSTGCSGCIKRARSAASSDVESPHAFDKRSIFDLPYIPATEYMSR
jgi:uncharacterized protein Usg